MKNNYATFGLVKSSTLAIASMLTAGLGQTLMAESLAPAVQQVSSENPAGLNRQAVNTVNGSGLVDGKHRQGEEGIVWTTLGQYDATDYHPFITYDLGSTRDITAIHVWNYNSTYAAAGDKKNDGELSTLSRNMTVIGPKEIEILTSVDGKKFTSRGMVELEQATGEDSYRGQKIRVNYPGMRFVKFVIKSTHEGTVFDGTKTKIGKIDGRALTGLSEVRFETPGLVEIEGGENGLSVKEGGQGAVYRMRLNKKPASSDLLSIKAVPSNQKLKLGDSVAGMSMDLVFTDKNWDQWQEIRVDAENDSLYTPKYEATIHHFIGQGKEPDFKQPLSDELVVTITEDDEEVVENLKPIDPEKRLEWFGDIRYYWFIHWGPSSLSGQEISWSRNVQVPKAQYDQLYKKFNPTEFDADEWVRVAKAAGFKTMVFTAKHHDGFCMWDTKTTDYNIMNTPFKRDVIKELSEACKKHGLRFSLYYSVMDWYNPDWPVYFAGGPGYQLPEGQKPDIDRYMEYMKAQVKELFTKYGDISLMWWDGTDGRPQFAPNAIWTKERAKELEAFSRSLQPAMVMNNRVGLWDGNDIAHHWWMDEFGDFDTSEMGLSDFNVEKPWEYTFTLGTQWAWKPNDGYKSTDYMIQFLVGIAGRGGNCHLDIGPPPTGKLEENVVKRLTDIGNWLKINGESYYETRGGPYKPGASNWGASTRKGNRVYLHVMNWPAEKLVLPALGQKIVKSWVMTGGELVLEQSESSISIDVPTFYRKPVDTIVVLELEGSAMEIEPIVTK